MKKLLLGLGLVAVAFGAWLWSAVMTPYRGFAGEAVFVEIPRGTGTAKIASLLEEAKVVPSARAFQFARLLAPKGVLQAGDYRFHQAASPLEVWRRIARGDVYRVEVTFPEGSSRFDIARLLEQKKLVTAEAFLAESADPALIQDLAPRAASLEGYLFPATYEFGRRVTARQICQEMTRRFRAAWKAAQPAAGADLHRAVTLASLIEKETGVPEERPVVSGVYLNRLAKGMRLECDPTVIYAAQLEGRWRGKIYRSDLDRDHPYNTYRRAGLPPGPIANAGLKSLEAALRPAETEYLFFVARGDGSGGHSFSRDLAAHQKAVAGYRRALKEDKVE